MEKETFGLVKSMDFFFLIKSAWTKQKLIVFVYSDSESQISLQYNLHNEIYWIDEANAKKKGFWCNMENKSSDFIVCVYGSVYCRHFV